MKNIILVIVIINFFSIWSGSAYSDEIGYGEIKNETYINEYFNMSLTVPKGWSIQSKAAIKEISERGSDLIAGDDENLRAAIKVAEKQTVNLFAFFKYEQGAPVDFNPSIMAAAERVVQMPGITKGSDYLFHLKKTLQAGQLKYTFPKETYAKTISGSPFDVMPTQLSMGNTPIYQEYYSIKIKDYVLSLILTYSSENEKNELVKTVNNLKLNR